MAAVKRKSSEGPVVPAKKLHKTKKTKETVTKNESKKESKTKGKKKGAEKAQKTLTITFPEEGKVEWNTIKKQSKQLTEARKQKKLKSSYDQIQEAKRKFEIFRNHKCQGAERAALVLECAKMLKGLLSAKARSHDVSRLVQWLLKLGSVDVRKIVVGEISSDVVALAKCKYSSHIVKNVVNCCDSAVRRQIIAKFNGQVLKLLLNKISAPILEDIYLNYATSAEKFAIRRELYGDLCKPLIPSDREFKFADLLDLNKPLASSILSGIKSTLSKCIEKNWLLGSSIVSTVMQDYLTACSDKDRTEMLEPLRSHISTIIRSKPGADVGLIILRYSSAKEKKEIIKDIKGDIGNIAVSPCGCLFLLHLIDSVDDTVLMKKALLPTVIDNADELVANEHGRKLVSYIVAHRDGHFFHPSDVSKLKTADESAFVKKSSEVRMKELQEASVPVLLTKIGDDPKLWLKDGCTCLLTASILQIGSGEKLADAFNGIATFLTDPDSQIQRPSQKSGESQPVHPIEDAAINKILKKLIKTRTENEGTTFAEALASKIDKNVVNRWVTSNRGCFTLVFLLESAVQSVVDDLKPLLTSPKTLKALKNSSFKGAEILLGLLD